MKQIKPLVIVLLLAVLIVPSVAFASWWNPFSWHIWDIFFSKPQTSVVQPVQQNQNTNQNTNQNQSQNQPVQTPVNQTANWKTYTNNNYGFQINYPNNLIDLGQKQFTSYLKGADSNFMTLKLLQMSGKNTGSESIFGNLQISVGTTNDALSSCLVAPSNNSEGFGGASGVGNITINGTQFLKYSTSDAGLGNRLAETIYDTIKNNICYRLEVIESGVGFTAGADVDKNTATTEATRYGLPFSAYDVFNQLTPIVQTFKFTN